MDACVNNFKTQIHPSFQSIQPNRKLWLYPLNQTLRWNGPIQKKIKDRPISSHFIPLYLQTKQT
jgi:hypothetical protein